MASLSELQSKRNTLVRIVEFGLGTGLMFLGIAYLAGSSPEFAKFLSKVTGAKLS